MNLTYRRNDYRYDPFFNSYTGETLNAQPMWRTAAKRMLRRLSPRVAHYLDTCFETETVWSIGIYQGKSPAELKPLSHLTNPVLTRADVTDVPASFVADPFMVRVDGSWHMYFEVLNKANGRGEIGYAVSSNGMDWQYQHIVLAEPFHLSYPCVFEWKGDYYMIPESRNISEVRLYRASQFPTKWRHVTTLLAQPYADSTVFRFENRWWMFTDSSASFRFRHRELGLGFRHDTLRLFYSEDLTGPWKEHPKNPIIHCDPHVARPGGRVSVCNSLIRFAQDCYPVYGKRLFAFRITELSPTCYEECEMEEGPALGPSGSGWNRLGMHHVDAHQTGNGLWIACVDGFTVRRKQG